MIHHDDVRQRLTDAVAEATLTVPGVAFLRPGLADHLRAATRPGRQHLSTAGPPGTTGGIRLTRHLPDSWAIDIRVVVRADHRALDVTRSVVTAVRAAAAPLTPGADVRVTVTVSGLV